MSTTSSVSSASTAGSTSSSSGSLDAFRKADFLKIMMAEVTNQDPMQPQETAKLVEGLQQLQQLSNQTYDKFRKDITWANDLMGKTVKVQQSMIDEKDRQSLVDKGLKPDVGYGQVDGKVDSFRVVDQTVYVSVKGKDYPIDNLKQIIPQNNNADYLTSMSNDLLGKTVSWRGTDGKIASGTVNAVKYDENGNLQVQAGSTAVSYTSILQIGTGL